MGKGARKRINQEQKRNERLIEQQRLEHKKKVHRLTAIISGLCAVLIVAGVVGVRILSANGYFLRHTVSVTSANMKLDNAMMSYFFRSTYQSYLSSYSSSIQTDTSLKDQTSTSGETWFEVIMQSTKSSVQQLVTLAEAAKAAGVSLEDDDKASIQDSITNIEKAAKDAGKSVAAYIEDTYGKGVRESDIRRCLELSNLASKYYNVMQDSYTFTDDEINSYYESNKNSYLYCDYKSYTFTSTIPEDATADETSAINAATKAQADALAKCKTSEAFDTQLTAYLRSTYEGSDKTADEIQTAVDQALATTLTKDYAYTESSTLTGWAFAEGRAVGDTTVIEGTNSYTTYYLVSLPARQEYATKNVRHILLSTDTYGSATAAKAKAEEVLASYQSGEQSAKAFGTLAAQYSDDPGSKNNGGLYENVAKGTMVEEFETWCYDDTRTTGDTGIIQTDYGYHIMYFDGNGVPAWKSAVTSALVSNQYSQDYEALEKTYAVTFSDKNLNKIDA